ncbi:hypothiocyanous acid reductase MerA [Streptococcus halichoeri]|uniref:hypothiocyanous acid reductase MerA n=1 Tax=Streptococcus halichoeri TaxID=254785 RepID=UPI0013588722|nr:hypothiocyanous acid reductase MerA [Streptococcus halichoeri]
MKTYDVIIIGFGKAGKTFAKQASKKGKKVAVIEKSPQMYGGTCINIACIPTKVLVEASREGLNFKQALQRKQEVVTALNQKNYHLLADDDQIDVIDGWARFQNDKTIAVYQGDKLLETLTAPFIIINTGAKPNIPDIPGLKESAFAHDSTSIMTLESLPQRLVIIGGGYISLEFASFFATFGSQVTILESGEHLMPREDAEIVAQVEQDLTDAGISIHYGVQTTEITDFSGYAQVATSQGDFAADAILVATGRRPNTDQLGLENTGIKLGQHGEIAVDDYLETTVPGVYAVGDVKGGPQFTYISLDDSRILADKIFGAKERSLANRGAVPYAVFMTPVLGRVGLTYQEAVQAGYDVVENKVAVKQMPRHKINNDARGLFKVVINKQNHQILGASLYGENAEELINVIKMAIDQQIPYTYFRDNIFTHPTMIESFNDLMAVTL